MINSLGHHFFPVEVETELGQIDKVEQYLIAGVLDPRGVVGGSLYLYCSKKTGIPF